VRGGGLRPWLPRPRARRGAQPRVLHRAPRSAPRRRVDAAGAVRAREPHRRPPRRAPARPGRVPARTPARAERRPMRAPERDRTEEGLRSAAAEMRAVLDSALDAVVGMSEKGTITFWNPRAEAIFGWSADEDIRRCTA